MALNLNQVRVFRAIAEHGSVTAGARSLKISQPAASQQLAELEETLGVVLLERGARGTRLTAAGEVLQLHARRLFREEQAAEEALRSLLGLQQGSLSVGASTTIGNYLVPSLLSTLHQEHPGLSLSLQIGNTQQIQKRLLDGELDLALTEGGVPSEQLQATTLTHDEMVLIVPPSHALAQRSSVTLSELRGVPWLVREPGSGSREIVEAELAKHGAELKPVMTLGSTEALKNAVQLGLGVAMVSRLTVENELAAGGLRTIVIEDLTIRRALHLVTAAGRHQSPAAAHFLQLLRERYAGGGIQSSSDTPAS